MPGRETVNAILDVFYTGSIISLAQSGGGDAQRRGNSRSQVLILLIVALAPVRVISMALGEPHIPDTVGKPTEEVNFITAIQRAKDRFASGSKSCRSASRPTRAREICDALPSLQIQNWVGTIEELTSNNDGKGVVAIKIGEDILVKTWNNSLSDIADKTLIDPE